MVSPWWESRRRLLGAGIRLPLCRYRGGIGSVDRADGGRTLDTMGIGVLGPLTIDGVEATISRRDRVVLQTLVALRGATLSADGWRMRCGETTGRPRGTRTCSRA